MLGGRIGTRVKTWAQAGLKQWSNPPCKVRVPSRHGSWCDFQKGSKDPPCPPRIQVSRTYPPPLLPWGLLRGQGVLPTTPSCFPSCSLLPTRGQAGNEEARREAASCSLSPFWSGGSAVTLAVSSASISSLISALDTPMGKDHVSFSSFPKLCR